MPRTTEEARAHILQSITSTDPISALQPSVAANDFRLAVREALRGSRSARLGRRYARGGGKVPTPGRGDPPGIGEGAGQAVADSSRTDPSGDITDEALLAGRHDNSRGTDAGLGPSGTRPIRQPGPDETFREYWESHFDTYNASEIDKLFGEKDIGSLSALNALEKLPWIGRAIGWASGIPLIGGWIGKKGGEWVMNRYFNQKTWQSPTDPENPFAEQGSGATAIGALLDPYGDRFLPNSNRNVSDQAFGTFTKDGPLRKSDLLPRSGQTPQEFYRPRLGQEGGMPGSRGTVQSRYTPSDRQTSQIRSFGDLFARATRMKRFLPG